MPPRPTAAGTGRPAADGRAPLRATSARSRSWAVAAHRARTTRPVSVEGPCCASRGARRWRAAPLGGVVVVVSALAAACEEGEPPARVVPSVPIPSTIGRPRSPDLWNQAPDTTAAPAPNTTVGVVRPRVLLVGDSTLLAVSSYGTEGALLGFDAVSRCGVVPWIASDGSHLEPAGAYGAADYISRWVAHLAGAACPSP